MSSGDEDSEPVTVADSGRFPTRYLVEGSRKAKVEINLTSFSVLAGTVTLEVQ